MKGFLILGLFFMGVSFGASGQEATRLSNVLVEYHQLTSNIFDNTRTLRVLLPRDYYKEGNEKEYRILLLNDGQCVFDPVICQFSNGEWRVDEAVDSLLTRSEIEPLIVVGIDNIGSKNRGNEYLPWEDIYLNPPIPNPQGSSYPDFLATEVLPFLRSTYRISSRRADIGVGGSSYGALIAFYTYLEKPGLIGFLLLESPSFYVHDQAILKKFESFNQSLPHKVYLGIGTNELGLENCEESNADNVMAVRGVRNLKKMFLSKGLSEDSIQLAVAECATHSEESYAERFPHAIKFLSKE